MARETTLGALVKAVRRRLWLARTVRLLEVGLWVGMGLVAVCAGLHLFVRALPLLHCIGLAVLPLGLVSAIALTLRPPSFDYAARVADHWVDAKCLLLSAWELLEKSTEAETVTQRYVLAQASQATPSWRNELFQRPLVSFPNHAFSLVAVGLTSGFLLLSPGAEPAAARPQFPRAVSIAIAAADRSSVDAATRLGQRLLASLSVPRADLRPEKKVVRHPQLHGQPSAVAGDAGEDDTVGSAESGQAIIGNNPGGATEATLAGEPSNQNATPPGAGPGAGATGDLPGTGAVIETDDRPPPGAHSLVLRYVELERAQPKDDAAGIRRTGAEFERGVAMPATNLASGGIAAPARYAQTPLAATLSPAMGRYAADYFSALRKER